MDISNSTSNQQISQKKAPETSHNNASTEDLTASKELTDERGEVEKKIVALQKIVLGGERLPVEELFGETMEYILTLESQVKAFRFLLAFLQTSEKMDNMFG